MKKHAWALLFSVFCGTTVPSATAHGGGLDSLGCHHNRKAGGYHCHRGLLAGQSFASQAEARALLARKSGGSSQAAQTVPSDKGKPDVKVWVNTASGVYHCPDTRWYGKTKQGAYMTQKEAQDKGHRPAAGRVCK